jgi:cell shape-determining protein MreC
MTSGDGGQLPADIPVGVISSVGSDGIWVKPIADIDRATYVQVINADVDGSLATGDLSSQ